MKPFGYELLVDAYGCDYTAIDDLSLGYRFLEDAVKVLGVKKQSPPFIFHSPEEFVDKRGLSGWCPLIESGIQIHTLTAKNFVSVDYYTCGTIDKKVQEKLIRLIKDYFFPTKVDAKLVLRGLDYYK